MVSLFRCEQSENLGRYLISEKDFDHGDIVWEESPMISAPSQWQQLGVSNNEDWIFTCVGCYGKIENAAMKCPKCFWPCCSVNCSKSKRHKNYECDIFSRLGIEATVKNFEKLIYLRMVLSKAVEPVKYKRFWDLCSEYYEADEYFQQKCEYTIKIIWKFLAQDCEMDVSMDEVSQLWGVSHVNNFAIRHVDKHSTTHAGVALYFYTSLLSNSCCPNVEFTFAKNLDGNGDVNWNIRLYARKPIKKGSILSIAYNLIESQFGTVPRQMRIRRGHHFICKCERCLDNTEGGTYFQALVCPKCGKGYLLQMNPIEIKSSPWKCDKCNHMEEAHKVKEFINMLNPEPYALLRKRGSDANSLKLADNFIIEQKHLLHKNHFLMYQCALHWLLGSDFSHRLISSDADAETLFIKIMTRVKRYLPLCENFMSSKIVYNMHLMVAKTYAAYVFKSEDMQTFVQGNDSIYYKLRICNRIVAYLKSSFVWLKMKCNISTYERDVDLFNQKILCWSERLQVFQDEIETLEEQTLESIRFLFRNRKNPKIWTILDLILDDDENENVRRKYWHSVSIEMNYLDNKKSVKFLGL